MAEKYSKVPSFSFNLREFFSLALETLLEDLEGRSAYWFTHPESTNFWDNSGIKNDLAYSIQDIHEPLTKNKLSSIKDISKTFNEITLIDKSNLKKNNALSISSLLVIPIISENERLATIVILNIRKNFNLANFKKKLSLFIKQIQITLRSLQIQNLAYIDDLTGLYNSRAFSMLLDQYFSRAKRTNSHFSVLLIDIDYLKKVNDTYGHLSGSQLLKETGKIIKNSCRSKDKVFRYGGDEFAVILDSSNVKSAQIIAERIRRKIEDTVFELKRHLKIKITVCIGIASFPEHATSKEHILQMADQAMYEGKSANRNTVSLA